jgi:catechol 2,3-dioxygenase
VLDFERMTRMPSASFVSAGGYHHHIGMNTWAGIGVPAPPKGSVRLFSYELLLPSQDALNAVGERLRAAGVPLTEHAQGWKACDPSHNLVLLRRSA